MNKVFDMDIQTEKIRIAQTILATDDVELIQAVNVLLKKAASEDIIGSKPDGTPLTRGEFREGMALSEQQIQEGKLIDIEDILKENKTNP